MCMWPIKAGKSWLITKHIIVKNIKVVMNIYRYACQLVFEKYLKFFSEIYSKITFLSYNFSITFLININRNCT